MTHEDDRLHDAVSADNVRRLLAGTLTDPMPGTLAAEIEACANSSFDVGFKAGKIQGRPVISRHFVRSLAIAGAALIAAALGAAAVIKPAAEAYGMGITSQCRDQLLAAAAVELHGIHCPGAADYGHSEASIALCAMAGGRTPEQVARLPICEGAAPVRLTEGAP
jgi:hypothetical protein